MRRFERVLFCILRNAIRNETSREGKGEEEREERAFLPRTEIVSARCVRIVRTGRPTTTAACNRIAVNNK